jgi:hypothetical protein
MRQVEKRLALPSGRANLQFEFEGSDFIFKSSSDRKEIFTRYVPLDEEEDDSLYVNIFQRESRDPSNWSIHLRYKKNKNTNALNSQFHVKYLKQLPPEVFTIVEQLIIACQNESKRFERSREELRETEQCELMKSITGASGLLSSNPLVRGLAQRNERVKNLQNEERDRLRDK